MAFIWTIFFCVKCKRYIKKTNNNNKKKKNHVKFTKLLELYFIHKFFCLDKWLYVVLVLACVFFCAGRQKHCTWFRLENSSSSKTNTNFSRIWVNLSWHEANCQSTTVHHTIEWWVKRKDVKIHLHLMFAASLQ